VIVSSQSNTLARYEILHDHDANEYQFCARVTTTELSLSDKQHHNAPTDSSTLQESSEWRY